MSSKPTINIPSDMIDPFYRYKRHPIVVNYIKKNNGITTLENIIIIAKELNRNRKDIIKFLQKQIGVSINNKNQINKIIPQELLEEYLEIYINNNVLCKKCNNPETDIQLNCCLACGTKLD